MYKKINSWQLKIMAIGIIGICLYQIALVTAITPISYSLNQLSLQFSNTTPQNHSIIYGNKITIGYSISTIGDDLILDPNCKISSLQIIDPYDDIIFEDTNMNYSEVQSKVIIINILNGTEINSILQCQFIWSYRYFDGVEATDFNKTNTLIYQYGGLTQSSIDYLPYILVVSIIGIGLIIVYLIIRKRNRIELPPYCNDMNPMTQKAYLYTDLACRQAYIEKYRHVPEDQPQIQPQIQVLPTQSQPFPSQFQSFPTQMQSFPTQMQSFPTQSNNPQKIITKTIHEI